MHKWRPGFRADYVISDLCGNNKSLEIICNRIFPLRFSEGNLDRVFFLGNYIGGGTGSAAVIDILINIKKEYGDKVLFLKGLNEDRFLNALMGNRFQFDDFIAAGGISIAQSYKPNIENISQTSLKQIVPQNHIDFLNSLEYFHIYDQYFFMYSGFDTNKLVSECNVNGFIYDETFSRHIKDCAKLKKSTNLKDDYTFISSHNFNGKKPFISQKAMMLGNCAPGKVFVLDLCSMNMICVNRGKERSYTYKYQLHE